MFERVFNVNITNDLTDNIKESIKKLVKKEILVGVPDGAERKDSHINNAQLLYIHTNGVRDTSMRQEMQHNINDGKTYSEAHQMYLQEHGSPMYSIPPRPVLKPAIEKNQDKIAKKMVKAVNSALEGKNPQNDLEKTAIFAQNKVRAFFTDPDNGWTPNAKSTIDKKGSDKPLIDTAQLRKSIVGIVGDKD